MNKRMIFVGLSCVLLALHCGSPPPAEGPAGTSPVADAGTPPPASGGLHHAAHGGVVMMHGAHGVHLHVEFVVLPGGLVRLYPSDAERHPIAPSELTGQVTCEANDSHQKASVALKPGDDGAAIAQCPPLTAAGANVTADMILQGSTFSKSVSVGAAGTAGPNGT